VITCGYSIINRTATADIGSLMLQYGGGGHHAVGACQVAHQDADRVIAELVVALGGATAPHVLHAPTGVQAGSTS
jgi:nanoRNase/pAp phosphatase (c-di-AMP/oligoRNAs hydrolase)